MPKITADKRPTDYEYALMSQAAYNNKSLTSDAPSELKIAWEVVKTYTGANQFFAALFRDKKRKQLVIAYRGTDSFGALIEDLYGVYFNQLSPQKEDTYHVTKAAFEIAKQENLRLSMTGHSLGAYLAEISVFFYYAQFASDNMPDVNAVTFESPGSRDAMEKLQPNLNAQHLGIDGFDIVNFVSYPNLINTCNKQIGAIYGLSPNVSNWASLPLVHLQQVHTIDNIVTQLGKRGPYQSRDCYMGDWPVGGQREEFFKHVELRSGRYHWTKSEDELKHNWALNVAGHFKFNLQNANPKKLPLTQFSYAMQQWLCSFYVAFECWIRNEQLLTLQKKWQLAGIPGEIIGLLVGAMLIKPHPSLQEQSRLIWLVVDGDDGKTAFQFREELSDWLEKNEEKAKKLLSIVLSYEDNNDADITAVLAEGKINLGNMRVDHAYIRAVAVYLPEGLDKVMIEHFEKVSLQFMENMKKAGIKIKAVAFTPGPGSSSTEITGGHFGRIDVETAAFIVGNTQPQVNLSSGSSSSSSSTGVMYRPGENQSGINPHVPQGKRGKESIKKKPQ